MCGGTKWIMRSSRTGSSRNGSGAPIASGLKKERGSFMRGFSWVLSLHGRLSSRTAQAVPCKSAARAC